MFQRISNIIKGLMDKGLSSAETPEILAEQAQSAMEADVKQLKDALVSALTNEKMLEQQLKKNEAELEQIDKQAARSVETGNDDLAKQFLIKKQTSKQHYEELSTQLAEQKKATAALKERSSDVQQKLAEFIRKKPSITARVQAGDAVSKANEILSNTSGTGGLDKWEQKIREKEARGEALGEIDGLSGAEAAFKKASDASAVDHELAALKAQMGQMPKLVVDKEAESKKAVVDENVPMKRPNKEVGEENLPTVVDVEVVDDDKKK